MKLLSLILGLTLLLEISAAAQGIVPTRRVHFQPVASGGGGSIPQSANLIMQIDQTGLSGSDNTPITTWTKVVGNDFKGTATIRTGANGLNSLPIAQFDGATQLMTNQFLPGAITNQTITVTAIFKLITLGNAMIWADSGDTHFWDLSGSWTVKAVTSEIGIGSADTQWHKLTIVLNAASSTYSFDGAAPTTFSATPGSTGLQDTMWLAVYGNGTSFPANCDIAALFVWKVGLTSGEQSTMDTYVNSVWGSSWPR